MGQGIDVHYLLSLGELHQRYLGFDGEWDNTIECSPIPNSSEMYST